MHQTISRWRGGLVTCLPTAIALSLVCWSGLVADRDDTTVRFSEHLIMDGYAYSYGIAAADLDGDGDLDLTSADALPHNQLYWFENDGQGNFTRHLIEENYPDRLERHAIGDINGDGHPDVVIVENLRGDLLWYENSGKPRDDRVWKRHLITEATIPGAYDVALADFDGDGHLDVAASTWRLSNEFDWFQNSGTPEDDKPWTRHVIEADVAETRTIRVADFNGDGKPDLLGTASAAPLVVWYENPGKPATQPWKRHVIDDQSPRPTHGQPVDLDGDGDIDVLMAIGFNSPDDTPNTHQIVWYENVGKPGNGTVWQKHVIGEMPQAFEAVAGDLDGDGDLDVAATAWGPAGRLVWFENTGNKKEKWPMRVLKDKWIRANQVIIVDLNGDKRPDIVAGAERGSNEVRWWRNEGRPRK